MASLLQRELSLPVRAFSAVEGLLVVTINVKHSFGARVPQEMDLRIDGHHQLLLARSVRELDNRAWWEGKYLVVLPFGWDAEDHLKPLGRPYRPKSVYYCHRNTRF